MKTKVLHLFVSALSIVAFLLVPLTVVAEGQVEMADSAPNPVIITEVQTGGAAAGDEFVELFNTSDSSVDITGWQVRFNAAGATDDATTLLATIGNGSPVVLSARAYFVLYAPAIALPEGVPGQEYTAALSKTDKTVALFSRDEEVCQMVVEDAIAWQAAPGVTWGEGSPVPVTTAAGDEKLLQRYVDKTGNYIDTNDNSYDFYLAEGTPGESNPSSPSGPPQESASGLQSFTAPDCELPTSEEPPNEEPPEEEPPTSEDPNEGLDAPFLTELLPNPGPPLSDANDEFIELYNPNDAPYDLSGFKLEAGITTKYSYTFAAGTVLGPQAHAAFYSKDTNISLANSSGQARLKDPAGFVVSESASYDAAGNDQAWALVGGSWDWVPEPTPNGPNEESEEPVGSPNDGLLSPQLTELLPDPGSGLSDSEDEFIELYNPNDKPFHLGGYIIEVGLTSLVQHIIPEGVVMQPQSYLVLYSADTDSGPLLTNTGGKVRLLDPQGILLSQTDEYPKAKADQAWALIDGIWQWTLQPTPGSANIAQLPTATTSAAAKTKSAAAKKATTKKSTAKKATKSDNEKDGVAAALTSPNDPLHPGLLALVGVFAVLYGAYEYRHDLANKIRIFRTNRAASRSAR